MKRQDILNIVYDAIIEVSPHTAKALGKRDDDNQDIFLVDLGINSIDYAEIVYIIMNNLQLTQRNDIFTCTNRIADVIDILYKLIHQSDLSSGTERQTESSVLS